MIKREQIGKKDIKKMLEKINDLVKINEISKKGNFERIRLEKYNIITLNKEPIFIEINDKIIPCIKIVNTILKNKVVIDMGALKFLINGADIMAPGIVEYDKTIKENDVVFVVDEKHNKLICVGIALVDFENLPSKGKVIKNIHYVGDKIWENKIF